MSIAAETVRLLLLLLLLDFFYKGDFETNSVDVAVKYEMFPTANGPAGSRAIWLYIQRNQTGTLRCSPLQWEGGILQTSHKLMLGY